MKSGLNGVRPGALAMFAPTVIPIFDLNLVQAGIDEGAGAGGRGRIDRHLRVHRQCGGLAGHAHRGLVAHGRDFIGQARVFADHAAERQAQHVEEGGLQVLLEEGGRDLDGQPGIFEGDGTDRAEPRLELLRLHNLLDDLQTVVPDVYVSLLRFHAIWDKNDQAEFAGSQCKNG